MRKKLNEIRNKEEGFTLVELLAVIVILGIIVAIAIPAVGNVIDKAKKDSEKAEYAMIVDAGRLYLTTEDGAGSVAVKDLIEKEYIEERDGKKISDTVQKYTVKKMDKTYKLMDDTREVYPNKTTAGETKANPDKQE